MECGKKLTKDKIKIWILRAGLEHTSPYFYNFCLELKKYNKYEYIINPNLPIDENVENGIVYFNRLKRFYNNDDFSNANDFLGNVEKLKQNGWKIVWTVHNIYPIDRNINCVDEYVTEQFLKKCDIVFTLSNYMKKSLKNNFSIDAINHGMGMAKIDNNSVNIKLKELKREDKFTYTFIGNIYKYKMIEDIIKSFVKLKKCRLIIAGREAKNAGVNIEKLIGDNKNIVYINSFIDENDWKKLTEVTDVFISVYDLKFPAFKYGFFPSNYINITKTGIKCISPKSKIFDEMISKEQLITYDFNNSNGLYNAMLEAKKMNYKKILIKQKYNYSWEEVVSKFIKGCDRLFVNHINDKTFEKNINK